MSHGERCIYCRTKGTNVEPLKRAKKVMIEFLPMLSATQRKRTKPCCLVCIRKWGAPERQRGGQYTITDMFNAFATKCSQARRFAANLAEHQEDIGTIKETLPRCIGAICKKLCADCNPEAVYTALVGPEPEYRLLVSSGDEMRRTIHGLSASPVGNICDGDGDVAEDDEILSLTPESHHGLSTVMGADALSDAECVTTDYDDHPSHPSKRPRKNTITKHVTFLEQELSHRSESVVPSVYTPGLRPDPTVQPPIVQQTDTATQPRAASVDTGRVHDPIPVGSPRSDTAVHHGTLHLLDAVIGRIPHPVSSADVLLLFAALNTEETKRRAAEEDTKQRAAEEETKRRAAEEETKRRAAEEDTNQRAAEEATKRRAAEEDTKQRAAEEETQRRAAIEATKQRIAEEKTTRAHSRHTERTKRKRLSPSCKWYLGARQAFRCNLCAATLQHTAEVDHVVPLKSNGGNEPGNLQILCVACHADKSKCEQDGFL
jgi:5-methylcytosine-specific restriction endonuclease McrA